METLTKSVPVADNAAKSILCKLPARIQKLIDVRDNGCWMWLGSTRSSKYKHTRYRYGTYNAKFAHRVVYQLLIGQIPSDREIDHLCNHKLCVNPAHLDVVTHQENCQRRLRSGPAPDPNSQRSQRGFYARRVK